MPVGLGKNFLCYKSWHLTHTGVVFVYGGVVVWWCGGVVVWWCGGGVLWWCGGGVMFL